MNKEEKRIIKEIIKELGGGMIGMNEINEMICEKCGSKMKGFKKYNGLNGGYWITNEHVNPDYYICKECNWRWEE